MATLSTEVIGLLGLDPRRVRLLSAVHEAGHVVVADTVGVDILGATVSSAEHIGVGEDHTELRMPGGEPIPIPTAEYTVILAAGFQASYLWLTGRGVTDQDVLNQALTMLAAGDIAAMDDLRETRHRPDLHIQDGIKTAALILEHRWANVLRIGYALAAAGTLTRADLHPLLTRDPIDRTAAHALFEQWRTPHVSVTETAGG
uniref:hypothetical protein n=1 Tax=Actinokineospora sp. CA-119265 TaxID=3239890 RepID=UPI003F496E0E